MNIKTLDEIIALADRKADLAQLDRWERYAYLCGLLESEYAELHLAYTEATARAEMAEERAECKW